MSVAALLGKLRIDAEMHTARIEQGVRKTNSTLDGLSRKLINVQNIVLGVAGAAGFGALVSGMIDVTNRAQAWEAGMLSVTGAMGSAKREIEFVRNEAKRLGIDLVGATDQFVKLAASAQGTALEGKGVRDIFSATMEAARVFNLSMDDAEGAMRALAQMISKSTVSMEEMRQQLGERIPGAMQAAARAMGMTVEEFSKAVASGSILAEDLLPNLAVELRKLTEGGLALAVNNPAAEFQRMKNAIVELGQAIGRSGVLSFFTWIAEKATRVVDALANITRSLSGVFKETEKVNNEMAKLAEQSGTSIEAETKYLRAQVLALAKARQELSETVGINEDQRRTGFTYIDNQIRGLQERLRALKEEQDKVEEGWQGISAESEGQIDAMIQDIMRGTKPIKEELLPALDRTKAAIKIVPLQDTIIINVRDLGNVAEIEGRSMEYAANATNAHSAAMQHLGASAREATGILSSLQGLLGAFGINIGGGAGLGIAGNLSTLFSALSNPGLLIPGLAGGAASLAGGNTGGVAGAAIGGLGGYLGGSAVISALLAGGPPTAAIASILPFIGPLLGIAGAGAGFFGGTFLQNIFDEDKDPRVSFGFYPSGTFDAPSGAFGQSSVLGRSPFGQIMIGGRDGQGRTSEMFDIVRGIEELDKIVAGFLSPEQIRRAAGATAGIGELTGAGSFDPAQTIYLRFKRMFDVLDNDLEDLWDTFQPTQQSLENFIGSLEILSELGDDARTIAANFDMTKESFSELALILLSFQEFANTSFHDIDNMAIALQRTPWEQFADAADDLREAANAFDGTEQSTRNLSAALADFGQTELQVAQQLRAARAATFGSVEATITSVRHGGMTGTQIWNESIVGANQILSDLQSGKYTDPAVIQAQTNAALGYFNTGYNALSPEQQNAARQDALTFLNALQSSADTAFQMAGTEMESIHQEMATTITSAMNGAATRLETAATNSERALTNAANNLSNVSINVNVGGSEING